MGSNCQLLVAALLLVVAVREGLSLECVVCNSFARPECETNPNFEGFKTVCPKNATSCRKMEQEIYYEDDYNVRTVRQCAVESAPMKCIERTGTYRIKIYYCHCEGDLCNGAGFLSLSLLLALVCGAMISLFRL